MCKIKVVILFLIFILFTPIYFAQETIDISCFHCHTTELKEYKYSIHYTNNILCTDCHGGKTKISNNTVSVDVMSNEINYKYVCSKCHEKEDEEFKNSIHSKSGGVYCTDCHDIHAILTKNDKYSPIYVDNIPLTCSKCHENQSKMQAWYYGIKTDRFDTYKNSFHYKSYLSGGKILATCSDCHEKHDIRPEDDPRSAIYSSNLPSTCGKDNCHIGAKNVFISGKVHEEQSVKLFSVDAKALITYFYIIMII